MQDIKLTTEIMDLLRERAILMAMRVRWYDAEHIAQYGRSCPKRVGSFGYSTLASEEKASEK